MLDIPVYEFGKGAAATPPEVATPAILGGKGAALAEMSKIGLPVPPGFTIPTNVSVAYSAASPPEAENLRTLAAAAAQAGYKALTARVGKSVLVSVRSGAPVSMPGMMDTILNVGITTKNFGEWRDRLGERTALDCRRRLIQMLGATALGVPAERFETVLATVREAQGVALDSELSAESLRKVVVAFEALVKSKTGFLFPDSVDGQLFAAVGAVLASWSNDRAVTYREQHGIPHNLGTAINIQVMVFGNAPGVSGSGVLFTRNPTTGENAILGEYLPNAQGEEVVAGTRTPLPLSVLNTEWPIIGKTLAAHCATLENHYKDVQDIEFTVQGGSLYILQTRAAKRTPLAAMKIARDLYMEGLIGSPFKNLSARTLATALSPVVAPGFNIVPDYIGLPAGIGVATGRAVVTSAEAAKAKDPVVLVTNDTDPDDIAGMIAAQGVLTRTGGATSHAAVVARALNKPCVTGAEAIDPAMLAGKQITLCAMTGRVWVGVEVPVVGGESEDYAALRSLAVQQAAVQRALPGTPLVPKVRAVVPLMTLWPDVKAMRAAAKWAIARFNAGDIPKGSVLDLTSQEDGGEWHKAFARDTDAAIGEAFKGLAIPKGLYVAASAKVCSLAGFPAEAVMPTANTIAELVPGSVFMAGPALLPVLGPAEGAAAVFKALGMTMFDAGAARDPDETLFASVRAA